MRQVADQYNRGTKFAHFSKIRGARAVVRRDPLFEVNGCRHTYVTIYRCSVEYCTVSGERERWQRANDDDLMMEMMLKNAFHHAYIMCLENR